MRRDLIIDELIQDEFEVVQQWALRDPDALWNYVRLAANFDSFEDSELKERYRETFDKEWED